MAMPHRASPRLGAVSVAAEDNGDSAGDEAVEALLQQMGLRVTTRAMMLQQQPQHLDSEGVETTNPMTAVN
jgi:hypothetical protein